MPKTSLNEPDNHNRIAAVAFFTGTLVKDLQDLVDTHLKRGYGSGEDETHVSTVNSGGVALAVIQALYQEKQQQISQLKEQMTKLEIHLAALESSK